MRTELKDETGNVYAKLTVLRRVESNKHGNAAFECRCRCGAIVLATGCNLRSGHTKSCGCLRDDKKQQRKTELGRSFWSQILQGAKTRNIPVSLTRDEAFEVFLKQQKRCALTRLPLTMRLCTEAGDASLDRIDSSKGYELGNVQWIHKDVNIMKNKFEQSYFISLCRAVSEVNTL